MRICDFIRGDDPGAHGGERIERLAHQPLGCSALIIAASNIVDDRVAEDVIAPIFACDVAAAASDDKGKFGLIVGRFRDARQNDVVARPDNCGGELIEDGGDVGDLSAGLGRVIAIVETRRKSALRGRGIGAL